MHQMSKELVIEAKKIGVRFADELVLKDLSFDVCAGDVVAVVGPNGAGKTTLIKAILGLFPATGSLKVFGRDVKKVLTQIGYVPQRFYFDKTFPLTVEEFLNMSLLIDEKNRVNDVLDEVSMNGSRYKLIGDLSGGQMQRVLIARALLNRPKLLILDEPTAGIDMEGESGFYDIVKEQNTKNGVTIVLISHEMNMVYKYASRVICLNKTASCMADVDERLSDEIFESVYGKDFEFKKHSH